jgi:hypothetical protein
MTPSAVDGASAEVTEPPRADEPVSPRAGQNAWAMSATERDGGDGLRVVIAEDSFLIREGLRELLGGVPELEVVAACADTSTLLEAVERESPDVVLSDVPMPPFRERARGREAHQRDLPEARSA